MTERLQITERDAIDGVWSDAVVTWSLKNKNLSVDSVTSHQPPPGRSTCGRAPKVVQMSFTPQELYGAMARCSHLHSINPDAVTFESEGCRHLISQHVDDVADDFFIMASAKRLKDFSRNHLVGVVGGGLAYLQMIRDGYVWCDHFENLPLAGAAQTKRSPDFVFNKPGDRDVALVESKATHGAARKAFRRTVARGYLDQVSPYVGMKVGGSLASHGFSIGSWMTSATRAELLIDHTEVPTVPGPLGDPGSPLAVRRGNYLTVLSMMFGPSIVSAIEAGTWPDSDRGLLTTTWLGREWLLGFPPPYLGSRFWSERNRQLSQTIDWTSWPLVNEFALELSVATAVFRSLSGSATDLDSLSGIDAMSESLMSEARAAGGAVFPDGLAVLGREETVPETSVLKWDPTSGLFSKQYYNRDLDVMLEPSFTFDQGAPNWIRERIDDYDFEMDEQDEIHLPLLITKE